MREQGGFYLCYKMILSDSGRPETGKETRLITMGTQLGERTAFGWCRQELTDSRFVWDEASD